MDKGLLSMCSVLLVHKIVSVLCDINACSLVCVYMHVCKVLVIAGGR